MSEVENQEAPEATLSTMPGADNHPMDDDQTFMSLDFTEEVAPVAEPEVEAEPEPVAAEAEPEVEAQAEPEVEAQAEPEKKSPMIPKARLDEALQKQKALQKQLQELTKAPTIAAKEPAPYDFGEAEEKYQEFLLDGESKKASELRLEINTNLMKSMAWDLQLQTNQSIDEKINQTTELSLLQQKADELSGMYPELNENSTKLDQALLDEVIEMRDAYIGRGYEPVDALEKSVNYVAKFNGLGTEAPSTMGTQAPQDEVAKKRAEVSRKLDAAQAQPPEMAGESSASRGETNVNLATLTDEEFSALPESTLARLRGDIL